MTWTRHRNFIRTQAKAVLVTQSTPLEIRDPDYQNPFQLRSLWSDKKERHMNSSESEAIYHLKDTIVSNQGCKYVLCGELLEAF